MKVCMMPKHQNAKSLNANKNTAKMPSHQNAKGKNAKPSKCQGKIWKSNKMTIANIKL